MFHVTVVSPVLFHGFFYLWQLVKFVSDPCTLDIDGISVGLTSTDILFHLGAEEISGYVAANVVEPIALSFFLLMYL
jgi:hypothetical protein